MSAGTESPVERWMMSPGTYSLLISIFFVITKGGGRKEKQLTISDVETVTIRPSRMTVAFGLPSVFRLSIVFSA
jgi:hypothetical protein